VLAKPVRQLCDETRARRWSELLEPRHEQLYQPELVVRQDRRARVQLFEGGRRLCREHEVLRPVPYHDRPGHQVPEALVMGVEEHEEEAHQMGPEGLDVHQAQEIADHGGRHGHRVSRIHDDPDADPPLARCAARAQSLEQREVTPEDQERESEQHGARPTSEMLTQTLHHRERDGGQHEQEQQD
jgi:hypothetical protein